MNYEARFTLIWIEYGYTVRFMSMHIETLKNCFPISMGADVKAIESSIDLSSKYKPYEPFEVSCEKSLLTIPQRVYVDECQLNRLRRLTSLQKEMVYCFYSRHCDGFVRERCLREIIDSDNLIAIPFILQLLGEYVIEIIDVIYSNREKINKINLVEYIKENPQHYEITKQRVYSYWDCYYRWVYPKYKRNVNSKGESYLDYPGIKMLKHISTQLSGN